MKKDPQIIPLNSYVFFPLSFLIIGIKYATIWSRSLLISASILSLAFHSSFVFAKQKIVADTINALEVKTNNTSGVAHSQETTVNEPTYQLPKPAPRIRYWPIPNLLISSYIANFFAGDVIKDASGDDRFYFHIGIHLFL